MVVGLAEDPVDVVAAITAFVSGSETETDASTSSRPADARDAFSMPATTAGSVLIVCVVWKCCSTACLPATISKKTCHELLPVDICRADGPDASDTLMLNWSSSRLYIINNWDVATDVMTSRVPVLSNSKELLKTYNAWVRVVVVSVAMLTVAGKCLFA